jgi:preprotein translocase subunit SecE
MTDEIKIPDAGTADKAKLGVAIALVVAGVAGYYALEASPAWLRWLSVAAGLVLAALVVTLSRYGSEFRQFVDLARVELRKVVWPSREETGMTTLVVFVFVIVAGLFFWALDFLLAWATRALTGQGG